MDNLSITDYGNLWDRWLQSRQQNPPDGYSQVRNRIGAPPNNFLTPEDMQILLNAYTPYDLYMKPNPVPMGFDYPTSAINIENYPNGLGIQEAIAQVSGNPKSNLSMIQGQNNYSWPIQSLGTQGIYEHEVGHYFDPRLNRYNNNGFMTKYGIPQGTPIMAREAPAINAEDMYWNRLRYVMPSLFGKPKK